MIPGNHDSRNVGYVHFEELIGPRWQSVQFGDVRVVAVDSTEPDLDYGQIGAGPLPLDARGVRAARPASASSCSTTTCCRSPAPGASATSSTTPATCSRCLAECGVDLVLSGHKHVPYAWRLEGLFVVNAGTCCSLRLRGTTRPCYNVIDVGDDHVTIGAQVPLPRQREADRVHALERPLHQVPRAVARGARRGGGRASDPPPRRGRDRRRALPARRARLRRRPGRALRGRGRRLRRRPREAAPRGRRARRGVRRAAAARGRAGRRGGGDAAAVAALVAETGAEVFVDLSDEPVLGYRERFVLASAALARGLRLRGQPTSPSARRRGSPSRCRRSP